LHTFSGGRGDWQLARRPTWMMKCCNNHLKKDDLRRRIYKKLTRKGLQTEYRQLYKSCDN
jgi:hypothetical protein